MGHPKKDILALTSRLTRTEELVLIPLSLTNAGDRRRRLLDDGDGPGILDGGGPGESLSPAPSLFPAPSLSRAHLPGGAPRVRAGGAATRRPALGLGQVARRRGSFWLGCGHDVPPLLVCFCCRRYVLYTSKLTLLMF